MIPPVQSSEDYWPRLLLREHPFLPRLLRKSSLHRPELCLPSQGHDLGTSREIVVDGVEWTVIPLSFKTGGGALFAYTFFNQSKYRTSSHLNRIFIDVWDRTVHGRIDRWAMLTVLVPSDDENVLKFVLREMNKAVK